VSVKSFSFNQTEILESIIQLHCPNGIELDMTYGNGVFYKNIPKPQFKFDKGDWDWCPEYKGTERQFECHKSITSEMVIKQIQHLM